MDTGTADSEDGGVRGASSPLQRAAARLQAVLPPGWLVELDRVHSRTRRDPQPVLRVRAERPA
ncbi:MAG: hypothetical protein J2P18_16065 [Nocardia sp.]|nr:hypothetical protein [Nocardia sp.]